MKLFVVLAVAALTTCQLTNGQARHGKINIHEIKTKLMREVKTTIQQATLNVEDTNKDALNTLKGRTEFNKKKAIEDMDKKINKMHDYINKVHDKGIAVTQCTNNKNEELPKMKVRFINDCFTNQHDGTENLKTIYNKSVQELKQALVEFKKATLKECTGPVGCALLAFRLQSQSKKTIARVQKTHQQYTQVQTKASNEALSTIHDLVKTYTLKTNALVNEITECVKNLEVPQ